MEQAAIAAIGGVALGIIGTLIGAGGGFLLLPCLVLLEPHASTDVLTAYSLAVVTANASVGAWSYHRAGRVDVRDFPYLAASTVPGAIVGAWATAFISRKIFDPIFGMLLLAIGVWLFLRPARGESHRARHHAKRTHEVAREIVTRDGTRYAWSFDLRLGMLGSAAVGFLSSLLGIGGGIVHVPFLASALDFPEHLATATSHAVLAVTAAVAVLIHLLHGDYRTDWPIVLATCGGAMVGAPIGAKLSARVSGPTILRILAVALASVGLRLLFVHAPGP